MKANEIMMGDWLRLQYTDRLTKELVIKDFQAYQIRSLGPALFVWSFDAGCMDEVSNIVPIPITPEFLERNGFQHFHPENRKAEYWQTYIPGGGDINVKITYGHFRFRITGKALWEGAYCPTYNGHLLYVHELQHAIRQCNLEKEIIL